MHFPKFWASASNQEFSCWWWSDNSVTEAQRLAAERARKLAQTVKRGQPHSKANYYAERPLREPVLKEIKHSADEPVALITRNSYGCQVLNTARILFIDVDLPEEEGNGAAGWFKKLFGGAKEEISPSARFQGVLNDIQRWTQLNPAWGLRAYETRGGIRLLATHALFDPTANDTERVFEALKCDPLYRKLCRSQSSFRARLTPKPWRCGLSMPPARWPWPDAAAEVLFNQWQEVYQRIAHTFAVCRYIGAYGDSQVLPEIEPVVKLHDEMTRAESDLLLA